MNIPSNKEHILGVKFLLLSPLFVDRNLSFVCSPLPFFLAAHVYLPALTGAVNPAFAFSEGCTVTLQHWR